MPGFVLTHAATIHCAHGGNAQPVASVSRVQILGQPVQTLADTYVIAGCPLPPAIGAGPCRMGRFTSAAGRVRAAGQSVLLQSGTSVCSPTGTPLLVADTQRRVMAR